VKEGHPGQTFKDATVTSTHGFARKELVKEKTETKIPQTRALVQDTSGPLNLKGQRKVIERTLKSNGVPMYSNG